MSSKNIEQMKKIIEEKKNKSSQQGKTGSATNNVNVGPNKGFKSMKRAGSLNK